MATDRHIIAWHIGQDRDYRLDLHPFGVRESWPTQDIWDVARREMRIAFGTSDVTCWGPELDFSRAKA